MIIKCTIDGNPYTFTENSDKPLNRILQKHLPNFPSNNSCHGANCGNCLVIFNNKLRYSCLIPAFEANNASIMTFEGLQKTRGFHDIIRAYEHTGSQPCSICYKAKSMIIETIVSKMEQLNAIEEQSVQLAHNRHKLITIDRATIEKEIEINPCKCIELPELEKIINLAYIYRSNRSVRKSQIS